MPQSILILALLVVACNGGGIADDTSDIDSGDPCADLNLPECPPECPDDWSASCGEPCGEDDEACGNNIGDGRECIDGQWQCEVHAPLGPDECVQICQ